MHCYSILCCCKNTNLLFLSHRYQMLWVHGYHCSTFRFRAPSPCQVVCRHMFSEQRDKCTLRHWSQYCRLLKVHYEVIESFTGFLAFLNINSRKSLDCPSVSLYKKCFTCFFSAPCSVGAKIIRGFAISRKICSIHFVEGNIQRVELSLKASRHIIETRTVMTS